MKIKKKKKKQATPFEIISFKASLGLTAHGLIEGFRVGWCLWHAPSLS
jgi:hypothetical protein